jgi:protein-tyrosine phosphatase
LISANSVAGNLADVLALAPNPDAASKVSLLLDTLYPGESREVPDPWYGEEDGYHEVFALITRACEAFIKSQWSLVSSM